MTASISSTQRVGLALPSLAPQLAQTGQQPLPLVGIEGGPQLDQFGRQGIGGIGN